MGVFVGLHGEGIPDALGGRSSVDAGRIVFGDSSGYLSTAEYLTWTGLVLVVSVRRGGSFGVLHAPGHGAADASCLN